MIHVHVQLTTSLKTSQTKQIVNPVSLLPVLHAQTIHHANLASEVITKIIQEFSLIVLAPIIFTLIYHYHLIVKVNLLHLI
jgi:hypothetical protein